MTTPKRHILPVILFLLLLADVYMVTWLLINRPLASALKHIHYSKEP